MNDCQQEDCQMDLGELCTVLFVEWLSVPHEAARLTPGPPFLLHSHARGCPQPTIAACDVPHQRGAHHDGSQLDGPRSMRQ